MSYPVCLACMREALFFKHVRNRHTPSCGPHVFLQFVMLSLSSLQVCHKVFSVYQLHTTITCQAHRVRNARTRPGCGAYDFSHCGCVKTNVYLHNIDVPLVPFFITGHLIKTIYHRVVLSQPCEKSCWRFVDFPRKVSIPDLGHTLTHFVAVVTDLEQESSGRLHVGWMYVYSGSKADSQ